ncbi:MarR family transcriptional regulator [Candidatus Acetothermia bacterium]|nr:MarR family transcriptional regulator [Candidatus Acetothermia bacterium]MBI3643640.1 MarR family transcriptional regulator [Candidatus Acetothermia bacterium]
MSDLFSTVDQLHSLAIHLLRRVRREDEQSGLGPARLSALSVVVFGGPLSLGELAKEEQVRAPTMTRLVDALEEQGYVKRVQNRNDKRGVQISATGKGIKTLQAARRRRIVQLEKVLSKLNQREMKTLQESMDALDRALHEK